MKTFQREVCNLYLWAMLLILPILVHNKYEDITGFKEVFFLGIFTLFLVCSMIAVIGKYASYRSMGADLPKVRDGLRSMSVLDWSILAFGIVAILSSLTTRYGLRHALLADGALFVGGAMFLCLMIAFFLFSRGAEAARMGYIYGFYVSSFFVVLLGLLNHLRIDPLGMHKDNVMDTFVVMASTIGNFDYYHGYVSLVLMFFAAYRADMKRGWQTVMVDVFLVMSYLDVWLSRASGTYVGVAYGLVILVFMGLLSFSRFKNLFWQGILAGIAGILAEGLCHYKADIWYAIDYEISGRLLRRHLWLPVGIICLVIWLILLKKEKDGNTQKIEEILVKFRRPYVILAAIMLIGATAFVVLTPQGGILSGRAFIWDDIKKMYPLGSVREKIIGIGSGCIDFARKRLHMITDPNVDYLYSMGYETAHNELYEYGLELGILGVVSYICAEVSCFTSYFRAMLGSQSDAGMKASASDREDMATGVPYERELGCCAVLFAAYLGQGMTNGPNPVPTIVAFTFLALFRRYQIPDVDEF